MSGEINQANLKLIQNHWIVTDQIVGKETNPSRILIIFQKGDQIEFAWRDEAEKEYLLHELAS
jgi:hypothetical protein